MGECDCIYILPDGTCDIKDGVECSGEGCISYKQSALGCTEYDGGACLKHGIICNDWCDEEACYCADYEAKPPYTGKDLFT